MNATKVMAAAWALALCAASPQLNAQQRFVTIGTGGTTGVYYAVGGAICRLMNRDRVRLGIRCAVKSTAGSIYNLGAVKSGELDFGVVQSDAQYNAVKGVAQFKETGPQDELRAVFSVYPEALMVLARKEAGIRRFEDFKGKRFNVGNPGSGTRDTVDRLLAAMKMSTDDFRLASELKPDEHGAALCENRIDGLAYVVGSPAANLQVVTAACGAKLVPMVGPTVDRLVQDNPYFAQVTIPAGTYLSNPDPVGTVGVMAGLVTSSKVPDAVVYSLVASVFENLAEFRKMHPAFANIDPKQMVASGISAPLHRGALKYYKEKGWL